MAVLKSFQNRLYEFTQYHINGDGECNAILLADYAYEHNLTGKERFHLCYFFSIVYCCESAVILLLESDTIKKDPAEAADRLKSDMIFQSDRKYMKMKDNFKNCLVFWQKYLQDDPVSKHVKDGLLNLENALNDVQKWHMFGRFSAFLFLETYATVMGYSVTEMSIDWKNGDTATSGLLNLFMDDSQADIFDKSGKLYITDKEMDARLKSVASYVKEYGGDDNTTKLETSLCAYRKFYKGTRYNGYYLDRMLEEIVWYRKIPKYREITKDLLGLRRKIFPGDMLGELHGWDGIRKENKKLYVEYGII